MGLVHVVGPVVGEGPVAAKIGSESGRSRGGDGGPLGSGDRASKPLGPPSGVGAPSSTDTLPVPLSASSSTLSPARSLLAVSPAEAGGP